MINKDVYTTDSQIEDMKKELESARERAKTRKCKSLIKSIGNILAITVIGLMIFTLAIITNVRNQGQVPKILGFQLYQVETGSMTPNLPIGSIILSREPSNKEELKVSDIITFNSGDAIVTHRIIEVINENNEIRYRTKGDNIENDPDKDLVKPEDIRGKFVFKLPFSG